MHLIYPVGEGERLGEELMDPAGQHLVVQLVSWAGIWLLSPQDPLCGLRTARKRWDPPSKVAQKHLCQQAGQPGEENFKLGMMEREMANHS